MHAVTDKASHTPRRTKACTDRRQNVLMPGGQLLFTNFHLYKHFKAQIGQVTDPTQGTVREYAVCDAWYVTLYCARVRNTAHRVPSASHQASHQAY